MKENPQTPSMYGQANYGPQPPRASAYQQYPPGPPPPNLQFQQGPQAPPPPPLVQQAPPAVPPQISQPGSHLYQHNLPGPTRLLHPGLPAQVPPLGTPNSGDPYRYPPPSVHGSNPVSQTYSSGQQVQHSSHLGAQNVHHNPTVAPPSHGPPRTEMLRAPQAFGILPPLPQSQGQTSYRTFRLPLPYPGGVQGLENILPPPPPPTSTSSFFGPTAYGSSIQTIMGNSHVSSMAPPPPPSSPPPIPPSPPKSASSSFSISKPRAVGSGDKDIATNLVRDNASMHDKPQNMEGGNCSDMGSHQRNVSPFAGNEILNLPPPPSKPTEAKTVQRIEDLCRLIAKSGPGVEDVTRQKEYLNPEYDFLHGGEPGSEAAIGHEYFLWLKKKCPFTPKSHEGKREPPLMPLRVDYLTQPEPLMASAGCMVSDDSDMEMEDDITISDRDQEVNHSTEALSNVKELGDKEQLHALQTSAECDLPQDISSEKLSHGFSNLHKQFEGLTSKSTLEVHSQVMHSVDAAECPLDSQQEKSVSPLADNLNASCASVVVEANNSKKCSELIKGGSPFRLLQGYASDDSSEDDDKLMNENINPLTVLPTFVTSASNHSKDTGSCLERDTGSKSQQLIRKDKKVSGQLSESSLSHKAANCSRDLREEVKDAGTSFMTTGRADGCLDINPGNKSSATDSTSHVDFQRNVTLDVADGHVISKRGKTKENEEKKEKSDSTSLKVDEFGRLVREGSSDSDSDSGHTNKHERRGQRGRSRSRSRSRSPLDRRTRRSSWRRKEKRSRSRSWSPRNRRSRSRSPAYRRAAEFTGEKMRSNRGRIPECFDFLRGRCNRGASCRYKHPEIDKSDSSRRYRSKQKYLEVSSSTKNYKTDKDTKKFHQEHVSDEAEIQERQDSKVDWKRKDIITDSRQSFTLEHNGQLINSGVVECHSPVEVADKMRQKQIIREKSAETNLQLPDYKTSREKSYHQLSVDSFPSQSVSGNSILNSHGDICRDTLPLVKNFVIHQPQSNTLVAEVQNTDYPSHSSVSEPSPNQTSLASPKKFSNNEVFPNNILPTQSLPNASSCQAHLSEPAALPIQLPPPPPLPPTQSASAPHMPQLPVDYSLVPQVTSYALQSAHAPHSYHQVSLANQHQQFSVPPSSSWSSLPPPPPRPSYDLRFKTETATSGVSSQLQHGHFPPRSDFGSQISVRPYPTELHSNSQVREFLHQAYPSMQELHRPKLESSGPGNPISPFGAASILKEDRITHQDVSTSLGHGSLHQKPLPSQELSMNKMLPFSSDLPSGELLKSTSKINLFSHNQQAASHLQYPLGDSSGTMPGKTSSTSQYPPDPDFGVSRISAHFNPYASTFEQPLSTKFSSNAFSHDKGAGNQYDTPFGLSHVAVDGQGAGSFGSRQTTCSPSSARAVEKILPRAGGDQYDPLFDSVEPSSNTKSKDHDGQKWEPATDSNPMEKHSGSQKPLDLEENNSHEVAAVASTTSMDNDEFGETADAEVGAVENESPSNPVGVATTGEIEAEMKSQGKKKKKKDSKSSKLFKIAIADFVKDVLKPSWRQGNMSKEAFKTIVKKTVDKVSGAMKGHQIPKSQAKINHYIDSSQRKLTKLVMGYVDKYVKS